MSCMSMTAGHHEPVDPDAEIGARVHQAMFRARMSQTRMAPLVGVQQSVLSRKLRGVVAWSAVDVLRAAQALNVPIESLLPAPAELPRLDLNQQPCDWQEPAGSSATPEPAVRRLPGPAGGNVIQIAAHRRERRNQERRAPRRGIRRPVEFPGEHQPTPARTFRPYVIVSAG